MTTSGLASPPQPRTSLERPAAPPPVPERSPLSSGKKKPPRLEAPAVALSVFVHLLLVFVLAIFARFGPPSLDFPPAATPSGATSFEIVLDFPSGAPGELAAISAPATPSASSSSQPVVVVPPLPRVPPRAQQTGPAVSRPITPARPGTGATGGAGGATGGAGAGAGGGGASGSGTGTGSGTSTRDALRPGYRDPRLYAPIDEFPELRKTEHERYVERLQTRIDAVNDSMGFESNRDRTTSDWTVTGADGDRWGLSPEGLHLGGITIPRAVLPLPAATGDNQSLEAERERRRMREEIERQEAERERAETERERIDAMRRSGGSQ